LELWDTAGQHEYASIRQLSYPSTDVFVICFSVVDRRTLTDVHQKWYGEVRRFGAPIILLGNKIDLRRAIDNTEQVTTLQLAVITVNLYSAFFCKIIPNALRVLA